VTVDKPQVGKQPDEQPDAPGPSGTVGTVEPPASRAALERYGRRMRRGRKIYFAVIAVVVLAVGAVVTVAWLSGEAAHTHLTTVASAPPSVALRAPSVALQKQWQSPDRTAVGTPYWGGTVITYSTDSVRGRNASTGAITWSYTRTDRAVCEAVQNQGVTVAVFEHNGNCDQVSALDSGTGQRRWTRTLDKAEQESQPVNGHPTISVTQFAIMVTTPSVIYALDPAGGLDRWVYHPKNCTIQGAVIGTDGALISQTCASPKCDGLKFCGTGPQLLLRDANAGRDDDKKDNPDQIKWNLIGKTAVPASADKLISAVDPSARQLEVFNAAKGTTISHLDLAGGFATNEPITPVPTDRAELIWISGTTYAADVNGLAFLWTAPTTVPPTVTQTSGTQAGTPDLRSSTIAAATPTGIALLDPNTGEAGRAYPIAVPAAGSRVYPFGTGYVVAGAPTTVYQ
jgi:PQQ-like domain